MRHTLSSAPRHPSAPVDPIAALVTALGARLGAGLAPCTPPPRTTMPELQLSGPADALLRTLDALRQVQDPALGADIVELGLVESLRLSPGEARLRLVSPGPECPLCDFAADRALRAMQQALPDTDLYVSHDPWVEWQPGRASARLRHRLGWVAA